MIRREFQTQYATHAKLRWANAVRVRGGWWDKKVVIAGPKYKQLRRSVGMKEFTEVTGSLSG